MTLTIMIVSRENVLTKNRFDAFQIILILLINTGRTGAVMLTVIAGTPWSANRIAPPTRQHTCKTSATDTSYVRGAERL